LHSARCTEPAARTPQGRDPRIEDNSFLIEEAYNQEYGVVQEISTFQRQGWQLGYHLHAGVARSRGRRISSATPFRSADRVQRTGVGDIA
jgi:hypothetical protein